MLEPFQPRHGDYPAMFSSLLAGAGIAAEQITCIDVRSSKLPDPGAYAGYLITGSRHSVYDPLPWIADTADFVRAAMAAQRKVVGICFGHQLLAHFFGGRVEPAAAGWAVGVHRNRIVRQLPWMTPSAGELDLLSSHKDQVVQLPPQANLIAATEFCSCAGFTLGEYGLALQSHPEFSASYAADLLDHRRSLLGDAVHGVGKASLSCPLSNATAASWIVNFLQEG